jgi:multimeric flavodoxin WrbA
MKTIIINASPRKNWNTAQLLKEAQKGAESSGAETEYIDLYDLSFTGCRSCLACKRKDAERCKCYWKDDLSPLIDKILAADNLIIGTPIYFGEPTAQFRALYERLLCCVMSYDTEGEGTYYPGNLNTGIIYTMNAPKAYFETCGFPALPMMEQMLGMLLRGKVRSYASHDTVQVSDYSKFSMGAFDPEAKKKQHDEQFPIDLQEAFRMGAEMGR